MMLGTVPFSPYCEIQDLPCRMMNLASYAVEEAIDDSRQRLLIQLQGEKDHLLFEGTRWLPSRGPATFLLQSTFVTIRFALIKGKH